MEKRNTIQKQLVLEAVAQLHNHPTAEQVYAQVVKAHPTISKATVYRNLASLSEDGRLRHLPMPAGADRFDHRLDGHAHIECTVCGRLDDVEFSAGARVARLPRWIPLPNRPPATRRHSTRCCSRGFALPARRTQQRGKCEFYAEMRKIGAGACGRAVCLPCKPRCRKFILRKRRRDGLWI